MARYTTAILAAASLLALAAPGRAQQEPSQRLQGTWVRRGENCKVKLEVKPASLRCTVTTEQGMAVTVDADYVVSRDGILLGILRAPLDPNPADTDAVDRRLFHLQFTAEDRSLLVKGLEYKDSHDGDEMMKLLQGKYHKVEAKQARAERKGGLTMPSAHYLQHPPQYYAPTQPPASPKAAGSERQGQAPRPAEPSRTRAETQRWADDPNRRIAELLRESGESGGMEEYEWEGIWFNEGPSHLTPERVRAVAEVCCPTDWRSLLKFFTEMVPTGFNWVGR